MRVKPGDAHLPAAKFLHRDKFLAPRQFVSRHCTGTHLPAFYYRDNFSFTYQTCTATLVMLNWHFTMTAKTRAIRLVAERNLRGRPAPR
jgi:hypothetical protein